MSGKGSRTKGASAERELIKLLEDHLGDIVHQQNLSLQRNLEQTRSGGHDVIGLDDIAIEVKRQEKLQLRPFLRCGLLNQPTHNIVHFIARDALNGRIAFTRALYIVGYYFIEALGPWRTSDVSGHPASQYV